MKLKGKALSMRSIALLSALLLASAAPAQDVPPTPLRPPAQPPAAQAPGGAPPPLEVSVTGGISAPMPIAIPAMPTTQVMNTPAGSTDALGRQLADIVTNDLKSSGLFTPLPPAQLRTVMYPEVTAPAFSYWGGSGAQALVQGFIRAMLAEGPKQRGSVRVQVDIDPQSFL